MSWADGPMASCLTCGQSFEARRATQRFCSRSCWARHRALDQNSNWRGGKSKHPLYHAYNDMVGRCIRPTHARYADYGGRGITVCDRWRNDFWAFVADMGERSVGMSLDRRDNDAGYEPANCRWASTSEQSKNRRPEAIRGLRRSRPGTHCRSGAHELTPENTHVDRHGNRSCRRCKNARRRARRAERRAA